MKRSNPLWGELLLLVAILCISILPGGSVHTSSGVSTAAAVGPPHIVIIVADDMGWNDVGFHGSLQFPTPNIDALAYSGVILNNYYVQPICTPSRAALMTGRHPIHTGMQNDVIYPSAPYGLPLDVTTLPQFLKELGYSTEMVGKWHLGMFNRSYTPTFRGFDHHLGYWTGHIDYYDHTAQHSELWGYDFRRDMEIDKENYGQYATEVFTSEAVSIIDRHNSSRPLFLYLSHLAVHSTNSYDPLQAPDEVVQRFPYIQDENRRIYAAMMTKLDESVGAVMSALDANGMIDNTIIMFTTDNGGAPEGFNDNAASNWPLRGTKGSLWEGGMRGASFVWSPLIHQPPGTVSQQLLTIEDWLPTFYAAAGGDPSQLPPLDGINVWSVLDEGVTPNRTVLLHNIDPVYQGGAVKMGDWKLMYNPSWVELRWDSWFGPSGLDETAPEAQLPVILQTIRDSPAGQVVLGRDSSALNTMEQSRQLAQINCSSSPAFPTFFCRTTDPTQACLFNIASDPCEQTDVSKEHPEVFDALLQLLVEFNDTAVPVLNEPWDPAADPKYWDYNWINWKDYPSPIVVGDAIT